ncbi:MAG: 30S ribosomal protein S3ae [Nitrososphaerota archaeon]|nr:30S ribosomal protein S3ae [Candidatus Bathyarchaeota archaeon]MDW8048103.1 30S ribosomal protein S3ae [Nitrososphaerota archaeon]
MSKRGQVKDKWRNKKWYTVLTPPYFGNVEVGLIPSDEPEKLIGRVVECTLYDITEDFAHQYLKMYFQIVSVEGKQAFTIFKGHEYSRDYLRSLVRRKTTRVDGILNVTTKDGYRLRVSACAFTLSRIKTSQEREIRIIMRRIIEEKAVSLGFDQFVHEAVLGKMASDIYNEAKKIAPLRHVGIRKSKLISKPSLEPERKIELVAEAHAEAVE